MAGWREIQSVRVSDFSIPDSLEILATDDLLPKAKASSMYETLAGTMLGLVISQKFKEFNMVSNFFAFFKRIMQYSFLMLFKLRTVI